MRNTIGRPAQGEDFFDREAERRRVWRLLRADHVLLLAPRRVGKTSLMYKLITEAPEQGGRAAYVGVAGARSELDLVSRVYLAVAQRHEAVERSLRRGRLARAFAGVRSLKLAGVELVLRELPEEPWQLVGRELVQAIRETGGRWVLMLDELPVFILRLLDSERGPRRVSDFMHWFRELRQGEPGQEDPLRWLLAGSIGLDAVTRRLELGETINDLHILHLGAFDAATADQFLQALAEGTGLRLAPDTRAEILDAVGWLIPYHLQLLISVCLDEGWQAPTPEQVGRGVELLLEPGRKAYFDTWVTRLTEELGVPAREHALVLLDACARDPSGASDDTLAQLLHHHLRDARARSRQLAWLLDVLRNDGYLVLEGGRYRFRSTLLRAFWTRRMG